MGKKGLSFEEKRQRMLEFFYEKQEVLTLKELEKLLPKAKGIVSQSVKDVLQSLVDDSLIDFDKIGSGNFFWALPSGATIKRKQHEDKLRSELESLAQKTEELKKRKIELEADRKPSKEREEKLASLQENRIVIESLNSELEKYRLRGPERVRELEQLKLKLKEDITSWTDNVFEIKSFLKRMRPDLTDGDVFKMMELPEDLDYVE